MAKRWFGKCWGPSETVNTSFSGSWEPFSEPVPSRLLRTIAMATVSYENANVPPSNAGSGNSGLYLRVLTIPNGTSPPDPWPSDPDSGTDDVLVTPIIWTCTQATFVDWTTGATPHLYYSGAVAGGLVDVASERSFNASEHGRTFFAINGMVSEEEGPALDLFAAQVVIRQLWEAPFF